MSSKLQKHYFGEQRAGIKAQECLEASERMPNGKVIADVQICFNCGGAFPFKRGRRRCPRCQGLLRTKTMILKTF
ncbi:MAG: hypothetical protein OEY22_11245 [Candidatus Bathyarchaeota archaeon]|nr:hypothetical protein [Candidatus Bathyarchaeota archaeon]